MLQLYIYKNLRKFDVLITDIAKRDILEIYYYYSIVLLNENAAIKLLNGIKKEIFSLEYFPKRYRKIIDNNFKYKDVRFLPYRNFNIYYFIDDRKNKVYVIRVLYCKREKFEI